MSAVITPLDRAKRDAWMEKVMANPRMRTSRGDVPFGASRMISGGFETIARA